MKLILLAIKKPASIIILAIALIVIGIFGYTQLATNLLPDITYPMIKVYVTWSGASPEEIEDNIATIIERKVATVDDLSYLDSQCYEGLYALQVNFKDDADIDIAFQDVLSKVGQVRKNLPKEAEEPLVFKAYPSQLPVMDIIITSEQFNLTKLRTYAENELQDYFTAVEGTAGTEISGGLRREIRINLDRNKLQGYGITFEDILKKLKEENIELLGGRISTEKKDYIVRTTGEFASISELENLIIEKGREGGIVVLKDIAEIKDSYAIQKNKTKYNSYEGVKLSIFKQAGANTIEVSDLLAEQIEAMKEKIPADMELNIVYDQASYIRSAISGVKETALIAAFLVMIVSAFFLTGWKRVFIISITIPIILLGSFFFINLLNFSINIFTLGGLVVAMTIILDNCIVVLENITRIQEEEPEERNPVQKGVIQVSGAVTSATLTFFVLFLPFLLVEGLVATLFTELIITVAIIVLLSLIVSLTITPSLTALLFKEGKTVKVRKGIISRFADKFMDFIIRPYKIILEWSLKYRWLVAIAVIALFFLGIVFLNKTGSEFLPKADDGLITIKIKMPTGTSMEETHRVISTFEEYIKDKPYIEKYSSLSGGKIWGLVTYEIANEGEVNIQLNSASERPMTTDEYVEYLTPLIQKNINVPGAKVKVFHTKLKGIKQTGEFDIEIEVLAPRSEALTEVFNNTKNISNLIKDVKGLSGLDISIDISKPEYKIIVDRIRAADYGLTVSQVASIVKTSIDGNVQSNYKEKGYYYPIRMLIDEKELKSINDIAELNIYTKGNEMLKLSSVAEVLQTTGPLEIDRKDQSRVIKVTANVMGKSVGEVTEEIKQKISQYNLPSGYKINYGGQSQMISENFNTMIIILMMALFFSYVVLVINFEDFIKPFVILIRVPLSLIGVSYALYLSNQALGITVMIGFIILAGIEINQGVLLITFIEQLRDEGMELKEAIIKGAITRLRPIFITDINSIFGLLPLALSIGEGTELLKPMAIGVIGGLIFGLLLVFIFTPSLYYIFEKKAIKQ